MNPKDECFQKFNSHKKPFIYNSLSGLKLNGD